VCIVAAGMGLKRPDPRKERHELRTQLKRYYALGSLIFGKSGSD